MLIAETLVTVVAPEGIEPPTFSLGVRRSILLNYRARIGVF